MLWLCACVFSLNAWPPSSQKKEVFFFAVSLPQQLQCDNQQRLVEKKKGSCELATTFCQHTEAETYESERGSKVFLHERQRIPTRACWQATKPHCGLSRGSQQAQRRANGSTPHFCGLSQYLTTRRFYSRRHPRLLPNTRCKWSMREVASCILFKAHDNPPKPSTRCLIQIHSPICKFRCL